MGNIVGIFNGNKIIPTKMLWVCDNNRPKSMEVITPQTSIERSDGKTSQEMERLVVNWSS
jgi:hypothetical protein